MFDPIDASSFTRTSRRAFLTGSAIFAGGLYFSYMGIFSKKAGTTEASTADNSNAAPQEVDIVEFTDSGERKDKVHVPRVVKSESEWKEQLSPGVDRKSTRLN